MVEKDGVAWLKDVWPMLTFSILGLIWSVKKGRDLDHLEERVDEAKDDLDKRIEAVENTTIKASLCGERRETCQKDVKRELGHGEDRFKRLEETLKETRTELRKDMSAMKKDILDAIKASN